MKQLSKFVLAIACTLCFSCEQQAQKDAAKTSTKVETKSEIIKATTVATSEKSSTDKIVGKYYVDAFYTYLKSGFLLKNEKPKDEYGLYIFDFTKDGRILFKDITKFYGCGNGVLHISKGSWKVNDNGKYTLVFDGASALEYRFHSEAEYTFKRLKNGNIYLKLHKVITHKRHQNWDEKL